ncbi:MAG: glycosyltransferase [Myxococcales bacterium]|nr:glycosyltransferase [Myxococcales bacterium]
MRFALISGSYRLGFSYQENIWAEQLAARGHQVRVFAPGRRDDAPKRVAAGYEEARVATLTLPRNIFLSRGLAAAVRRFAPERILWFGPPQLFGRSIAEDPVLARVPLIAFMGQNRQMHAFDWRDRDAPARDRALALAYQWVRAPEVIAACRRAQLIVANTPETPELIAAMLPAPERLAALAKMRPTPLGFDPATFGDAPEQRRGPDGEVVAIVTSRFAPEKEAAIALCLQGLSRAMAQDARLRALVVGLDDGPISRRVRFHFGDDPRFTLAPFADRRALAGHFHHADVAVFARPSISAQEALGTGLYALLADDGAMDWLLAGPDTGALFAKDDARALADALLKAADRLADEPPEARSRRAAKARRLGYDRLIDAVLADLDGAC